MARISPIILLVIVILAIAFFALGLIQLLLRLLIKRPSFSLNSESNRLTDTSNSHTFPRQLQHLFLSHDSGLDRALIDALPIFYYKDIMGLKGLFDCAVCLSEFSGGDKLKFIPNCSHAFHIHCIETWLLSNSTCPLCRSLIENSMDNPLLSFGDPMGNCNVPCRRAANESFPTRVFSVRLGKFKNSSEGLLESEDKKKLEISSSSISIDARRCYSMGAFQYIVDDADLQVALSSGNGIGRAKATVRGPIEECTNNTEIEGKRIGYKNKGESFSVSKIWLWSKKGKFSSFPDGNKSFVLPMPNGSDLV